MLEKRILIFHISYFWFGQFQEMECQVLQSLLFCMHAFLTGKITNKITQHDLFGIYSWFALNVIILFICPTSIADITNEYFKLL